MITPSQQTVNLYRQHPKFTHDIDDLVDRFHKFVAPVVLDIDTTQDSHRSKFRAVLAGESRQEVIDQMFCSFVSGAISNMPDKISPSTTQ